MKSEIFNVVIPGYIEHIEVSKTTKVKYWEKKELINLPKGLLSRLGKNELKWVSTGKREILAETASGVPIVKNPNTVGKVKMQKISGQIFWSGGSGSEWIRRKVKESLTAYFSPYIARQLPDKLVAPSGKFLQLEFIFYVPILRTHIQDDDNHSFPYIKAFRDTLQLMKVIPDDSPEYIRGTYTRYVMIASESERRLEIKIHTCSNFQPITYESNS